MLPTWPVSMLMQSARPTGAEIEIRRRIASTGPITFREFMDVALYWHRGGYYTDRPPIGPSGDFFTSPLTHPVFGALISNWLEELRRLTPQHSPWWVVEVGAGSGQLALDITQASKLRNVATSRYLAVERASSPNDAIVPWARAKGLPIRSLKGVVIANELLDALPVHRIIVQAGEILEIRIGVAENGAFIELLSPSTPGIVERLANLGVTLREGQRTEVCLEMDSWAEHLGRAMELGYVLIVDYGHDAQDYYSSVRLAGTLRTYYQHTLGMNPYANVGRQDISIHVEITSLRQSLEKAGFSDIAVLSQSDFLRAMGFDRYREDIANRNDLSYAIRRANLNALDQLVDPAGMGGFHVILATKNMPSGGSMGLELEVPRWIAHAPLASQNHMDFANVWQAAQNRPTWDALFP